MDSFISSILYITNVTIIACAAVLTTMKILSRRRQRRSLWVRKILQNRKKEGVCGILIPRLLADPFMYRNYLRMDVSAFEFLLNCIQPIICFKNTKLRKCISPSDKLILTLRYLATSWSTFIIIKMALNFCKLMARLRSKKGHIATAIFSFFFSFFLF